jgi:hypothetical protein
MLAAGYTPVKQEGSWWYFKCRPGLDKSLVGIVRGWKGQRMEDYTIAHLPLEQQAEFKRLVERAMASYKA